MQQQDCMSCGITSRSSSSSCSSSLLFCEFYDRKKILVKCETGSIFGMKEAKILNMGTNNLSVSIQNLSESDFKNTRVQPNETHTYTYMHNVPPMPSSVALALMALAFSSPLHSTSYLLQKQRFINYCHLSENGGAGWNVCACS